MSELKTEDLIPSTEIEDFVVVEEMPDGTEIRSEVMKGSPALKLARRLVNEAALKSTSCVSIQCVNGGCYWYVATAMFWYGMNIIWDGHPIHPFWETHRPIICDMLTKSEFEVLECDVHIQKEYEYGRQNESFEKKYENT
jgi:hypothetical protein